MKKLLCLFLTVVLFCSAAVWSVSAFAAANTLTVTCDGEVLAEVPVGSTFLYRVGLYGGDLSIEVGQGHVSYDGDHVKVVEYGTVSSSGSVNMNAYSFPQRIRNASLYANYLNSFNGIYYSFSRPGGVGAFTDVSDHYFKIRFQATAAGTAEIEHVMELLTTTVDGRTVRLFNNGKPNEQLDQIPYTLSSVELPSAYLGDADGDGELSILDATLIQRLAAGVDTPYQAQNADVNGDGAVTLSDALAILRYKAGMSTDTKVGEWLFASEQ